MTFTTDFPTITYEDNAFWIAQIREGYINRGRTKYTSKFFYTYKLQHDKKIDVKHICSTDNFANLFTKSLPTSMFKKLVHNTGMRQLKKLVN